MTLGEMKALVRKRWPRAYIPPESHKWLAEPFPSRFETGDVTPGADGKRPVGSAAERSSMVPGVLPPLEPK